MQNGVAIDLRYMFFSRTLQTVYIKAAENHAVSKGNFRNILEEAIPQNIEILQPSNSPVFAKKGVNLSIVDQKVE